MIKFTSRSDGKIVFRLLRSLYSSSIPSVASSSSLPATASSFYEQSAGGINGRLAAWSASENHAAILAFYQSLPQNMSGSKRNEMLLNVSSFNYVIEALLRTGQQLEAFKMIGDLESASGAGAHTHPQPHTPHSTPPSTHSAFPNRSTFLVLMRGLVDADSSGSLAPAVDELFELMVRKYNFPVDLETWACRIKAFLHSKYFREDSAPTAVFKTDGLLDATMSRPVNNSVPIEFTAAGHFYLEMEKWLAEQSPNGISSRNLDRSQVELDDLRAELIVTAVNRRLWPFAEWLLDKAAAAGGGWQDEVVWSRVMRAHGLFTELSSIGIIRRILRNQISASTPSHSSNTDRQPLLAAFHQQVLLYAWRQGRLAADLALVSLRHLSSSPSALAQWWETAQGCWERPSPVGYEDLAASASAASWERFKCPEGRVKDLQSLLETRPNKQ